MRPWVLLRMHSIPFDEVLAPLTDGSWRQPHWKAFSPTAHVPCLHDIPDPNAAPDTAITGLTSPPPAGTLVLWNSLSIIEHMVDKHPDKPFWPSMGPEPAARAWARAATAEVHADFANLREERTEGCARFGGPFLAGPEFGAVDAMFVPIATRVQTYVGSANYLSEPAKKYIKRTLELPPVKEWLLAVTNETLRERLHDNDSVRGRKVLEDFRTST